MMRKVPLMLIAIAGQAGIAWKHCESMGKRSNAPGLRCR